MVWKIYFYQTPRGERVVKEFIFNLQENTIAKVIHHIDLLETHGPFLSMPYAKKLSGGVYELRIRGREEIRVFYTFSGKSIYLLHAFKKKSQKTPEREIRVAVERKSQIDNL